MWDNNSNEREIRVRKVITDLEDKQARFESFKKYILILVTYLICIVIAEIVTAHYNVEYGLILHTIVLFALLINASITCSPTFSNLLKSMMILPMIRIIRVSIHLMQVSEL